MRNKNTDIQCDLHIDLSNCINFDYQIKANDFVFQNVGKNKTYFDLLKINPYRT